MTGGAEQPSFNIYPGATAQLVELDIDSRRLETFKIAGQLPLPLPCGSLI